MTARALLTLIILPQRYAICRLDATAPLPDWAEGGDFTSITRTPAELSIVCAEHKVPKDVAHADGWRVLKCEGPLHFGLSGIVASLAEPLANAQVAIFPIATYDTDYLLVR